MEQAHAEDGTPSTRTNSPQTPMLSTEETHKHLLAESHAVERGKTNSFLKNKNSGRKNLDLF